MVRKTVNLYRTGSDDEKVEEESEEERVENEETDDAM